MREPSTAMHGRKMRGRWRRQNAWAAPYERLGCSNKMSAGLPHVHPSRIEQALDEVLGPKPSLPLDVKVDDVVAVHEEQALCNVQRNVLAPAGTICRDPR